MNSLGIRVPLALLLSVLAAAFCVAVLISGWLSIEELNSGRMDKGTIADLFFAGIVGFTLLGIVFAGLFTIAFSLVTQLPLLLAWRRRGRASLLAHILISAVLGPPLFIGFLGLVSGMSGERITGITPPPDQPASRHLETWGMAIAIGGTGGAAVGLVWGLLVLPGFARREAEPQ